MWLVILLLITSLASASPSWQWSTVPVMKITVRDKYGDQHNHKVIIIVSGKGQIYQKEIQFKDDQDATVYFPDDFGIKYVEHGKYIWRAIVNGSPIAEKEFEI